uniref:Bile salt export pump n=1 Tax=Chaetoceros debilis TaxID=122233 RepID=A0A7S3QG25_9STRA|mmetsp:Transcript_3541/g.5234  ORF Transcript_3541/g.5234 Transcript_3541/m.5234 type:complete len:1367 (+) Transcript_3541:125-4225(+)|eukprot:CAMPEP_0194083708 /NCGR_PEP_ID=MMETSP0149-20130528/9715_1 /TAXON_ID=122233 /ORGANISM="Chaetoceros debilis, Strain MM31A-1" /LENGTH=1366 /DNA_ID=CAMNT_0038766159 /DNA_START=79 /DNA_END=4179 /DNA_ORIENTATION=-
MKSARAIDTSDGVEIIDSITDNPVDPVVKPDDPNKKAEVGPLAPAGAPFAFGEGSQIRLFRILGIVCAMVSGSVYPIMAFYFSKSFEELGASAADGDYLTNITEMLYVFLILGAVGFVFLVGQSFFLESAASQSTMDFKQKWFDALLRQDMSYYDIKDVSAQATIVSSQAMKYKKGTGRKLGEGIQFTVTVIGGFIYAFYASWRVSLIVLAAVPVMVGSSSFMMTVTTKQTERKNKGYAETGGIVYSSISSIRTVFSLNAAEGMIEKFKAATKKSYDSSVSFTYLVGLGSGGMMASFLISYIALTLYGSYLLYDQVEKTGCDPSNTIGMNPCKTVGTEVFGALMGISFGAMGLSQIANAVEAFTGARAACHSALGAINRKLDPNDTSDEDLQNVETPAAVGETRTDIVLPKYVIDSSSDAGKKPNSIDGEVIFRDVSFSYPTRPDTLVFNGMNLKVPAGKTVALVGPSGSGKSTTVSMLERFYDPTAGSITLDGTDLRDINIQWLRDHIGLVSQEPILFARTIQENIAYGLPGATEEQIINVAKAANAHDFISQFPNGYATHVGDKGAQLSGGQKQRIAIARVLLKNPKILLLDEATSALDSESEYVVQEALDKLLGKGNRTTIVIAHRLSTVRNADIIAVVKDGAIVEQGTHDQLLARSGSEYAKLVAAQAPSQKPVDPSPITTALSGALYNYSSSTKMAEDIKVPQIEFKNVKFTYPSRPTNQIFSDLNLKVKSGETLAIVGPSGGGKSTVVQLIERFYDPSSGSVEFEGTDISQLNVSWYRDQLGFVSQEPTLFNTTIAENIRYGYPGASQEQIEEAARQANAHDFILSFPNGYQTNVGENATQVSGGQKQRIAIARALIKKPKVLLLDEATSALDTESERVVQSAIDTLMESKSQTIIVIAHRLSTIRNADRIAFIGDGILKEIGPHDELIANPNGHYKRLVDFHSMSGGDKKKIISKDDDDDEDDNLLDVSSHAGDLEEDEDKEVLKKQSKRARTLASSDAGYFFIGAIGAILAGLVFPGWGVVFAFMIELLFRPVFPCTDETFDQDIIEWTELTNFNVFEGYDTCQGYIDGNADAIRTLSYNVSWGWLGLIASTMIGNVLLFYGFGSATERMNKRVRDTIFTALMRQDIGYYDTHSVGKLSTQIEDDAALIHSYSGEPIRTLSMSLSSVLVGIVLSFIYMWPFALMFIALLPFMGFGAHMEMQMYMGEDEGAGEAKPGEDGAGALVVETLLSIRTVASLTIEKMRSQEYAQALLAEDPKSIMTNMKKGFATGIGFLFQLWGMGLMFWWGGFVMSRWPDSFTYRGFLISMFSALFSLSGLSVAFMGATDRAKAKIAADRIFRLIDRESPINALSKEGKKGV